MPDFDTLVPAPERLLPIQLCCHVSKAIIFCLREQQHLISPIILNQKSIFSKTKFTQTTFLNLTRGGAAPPPSALLRGLPSAPVPPLATPLYNIYIYACILSFFYHPSFPFFSIFSVSCNFVVFQTIKRCFK